MLNSFLPHIAVLSGLSFFAAGYIAPIAFPKASYKRVGALHFFRVGRFGGSLYFAKAKVKPAE